MPSHRAFPESALNEEAAKLMLEDYDEYFRRARMFTMIHAKPSGRQEKVLEEVLCLFLEIMTRSL